MQVVLVYLQPFLAQFIIKMCVVAQNRKKITKTPFYESSRSIKVIDVDNLMKLVARVCYDKQHVCARLSVTVFTLYEPIAVK